MCASNARNGLLQALALGLPAAVVGPINGAAVASLLGLSADEHPLSPLPMG